MSKLKWSVGAFARRVAMGEHDVWVVVEGRDHDRPYYDKLLRKIPATRALKFQIRLAEQIDVAGSAAGGKKRALAIHDDLQARRKLVNSRSTGAATIVFMVDRDRDDFSGTLSPSGHVMYTIGTDVEADILLNSDAWAAIRSAYGIDNRLSKRVRRRIADPVRSLATLWNDWLRLGLVGLECRAQGCAPWGQVSRVNTQIFGPVEPSRIHVVESAIIGSAPDDYGPANRRAVAHVAARGELLLKGRWVAKYIEHLVKVHLAGETVRAVSPGVVIDTALARLRISEPWISHYDVAFRRILVAA